jgi:nucleotide-binding universal stress UspA family protein
MTSDGSVEESGVIVVGVDGSDGSRAALRWAAHQAAVTGSRLHAVMTFHVPFGMYGYQLPTTVEHDVRTDSQQALADVVREVLGDAPGVDVAASVVDGAPAPTLIEASREADLLVVGSRGHGAFVGMLLGSVTQHCVSNAACPVVVVHVHDEPPADS